MNYYFRYALAKFELNYYIAYLQDIFAVKGVSVNGVLLGGTDTSMTYEFSKNSNYKECLVMFTGITHRLAKPYKMRHPVVFINSDIASYISYTLLVINYDIEIQMKAGIVPCFY